MQMVMTEVFARDGDARQLEAWLSDGVRFVTLEEIAAETLARPETIPEREIVRGTLPGRAGKITTSAAR